MHDFTIAILPSLNKIRITLWAERKYSIVIRRIYKPKRKLAFVHYSIDFDGYDASIDLRPTARPLIGNYRFALMAECIGGRIPIPAAGQLDTAITEFLNRELPKVLNIPPFKKLLR